MNNTQENPIIIINEQGFRLLQQLADLALRGQGMNAYMAVETILNQTKSYGPFVAELEEKIKKDLKPKEE